MPRLFANESTHPNRAYQLWLILISAAHNRQVFTYGRLATMMGYSDPRPIIAPLGHIMFWCEQQELPPLTVIVFSRQKGEPSAGLTTGSLENLEAVFSRDWFAIMPPSPEELAVAYREGMKTWEGPK